MMNGLLMLCYWVTWVVAARTCQFDDPCQTGQTCCNTFNGPSCCPVDNGCCCPDQQHCCGDGLQCDCSGTCPGDACSCTGCQVVGQCWNPGHLNITQGPPSSSNAMRVVSVGYAIIMCILTFI